MTDYQKYINALRKCAKEHENDRTFTGHIIVSDLCKDTANLLEALEQQLILDKIRAEIACHIIEDDTSGNTPARLRADWEAANKAHLIDIAILDRYMAESEDKE